MNRRALAIAFLVALLGVALGAVYLRRFEEEASGGEPVKLLAVIKPIEAGSMITEDALAPRIVPRAYVEDRAVLESEKAKVIGLRVGHTIRAQQTLMWTDLSIAAEQRRSLSSLVQPGMRAVTIRAERDDDSGFDLIRPGDRIDVIATMPQPNNADARTSIVLLQNILVLAVGGETRADSVDAKQGRGSNEMILSLSLNVQETQLLALATEKGRISVALRNPDDVRTTEGISDLSSSALSDSKARGQVQGIRKSGPVKIESGATP